MYKTPSGQYGPKITLSKADAISIARRFKEHTVGDEALNINLAAAALIFDQVNRHGLFVENSDSASEASSERIDRSDPQESRTATKPRAAISITPIYFPFLSHRKPTQITDDVLSDLAFVLSGVNPASRIDLQIAASGVGLSDLVRASANRISPTTTLLQDHQYALESLHSLSRTEFLKQWTDAKEQLGGQDATDLLKLSRKLSKFKLDDSGERLRDPAEHAFLDALQDNALLLVHRQFRSVRKKLGEYHTAPGDNAKTSKQVGWLSRLTTRSGQKRGVTSVPIDETEQEFVARYASMVCKLGRILRSEYLTRRSRDAVVAT